MREILVNALIHRDYTIAGGAASLAIFDDRVEVWSAGRYPAGITSESLTRAHPSIQRNPIVAEVFHRAGLIEVARGEGPPQVTPHVEMLVASLRGAVGREELMQALRLKDRKHFVRHYLQPAIGAGCIEMTRPDKPRSRMQRYQLTGVGQDLMKRRKEAK